MPDLGVCCSSDDAMTLSGLDDVCKKRLDFGLVAAAADDFFTAVGCCTVSVSVFVVVAAIEGKGKGALCCCIDLRRRAVHLSHRY